MTQACPEQPHSGQPPSGSTLPNSKLLWSDISQHSLLGHLRNGLPDSKGAEGSEHAAHRPAMPRRDQHTEDGGGVGSIPPPVRARLVDWGARHKDRVDSILLFGSRMRGDHRPGSDWDLAVVLKDGKQVATSGLPGTIAERPVNWVCVQRSEFARNCQRMSIAWVLAGQAQRVWNNGRPLEISVRREGLQLMSADFARHMFSLSIGAIGDSLFRIARDSRDPQHLRRPANHRLASYSADAAEYLCKAVLTLRGIEPRHCHSVKKLCAQLERHSGEDPLLPILRRCNGETEKARVSDYSLKAEPRADSERRVLRIMEAVPSVARELAGHWNAAPGTLQQTRNVCAALDKSDGIVGKLPEEPGLRLLREAFWRRRSTVLETLPDHSNANRAS